MSQFVYVLPLIVVLAGAIALFLLSAFTKIDGEKQGNISGLFILVATIIELFNMGVTEPFYLYEDIFGTMFRVDEFSVTFSMMFLVGTLLTGAMSSRYFEDQKEYNGEFFSLLLFALFGMLSLAHSNELITAFISLEIASLTIYVLAGYKDGVQRSKEAMMKYIILGSITSAFFVMGIAMIYGAINTTLIVDIFKFYNDGGESSLINLGVILITITLLFKLGAVPFHSWVVEVYKGAPIPVTMFMAAVFKLALFTIILRFFLTVPTVINGVWVDIIQLMAVLTLIGGTWITITQNSLKKLLAGSSIVHSGYLLIALAAMGLGSQIAPSTIIVYLISYFMASIGIFGVLTYVSSVDGNELTFDAIKGMSKTRPYVAVLTTIYVLSLAGIPLTIGFIAKVNLFIAGIETGQFYLVGLAVLCAFISIYYYFKIISSMYFYDTEYENKNGSLGIATVLLAIGAFLTVWGGVGVDLFSVIPGVDGFITIAKESVLSLK